MSALATTRKATSWALAAASVAFVVVYAFVALSRIRYPFELEWMEGGMVQHVDRVLAGRPIYAKPSLEFTSFLYPPLYYHAAALVARIVGRGFVPLRLLSFASSLGVLSVLFRIAKRETGTAMQGLLAAGLFAATYDRVGGWFDIARLDSFYLLVLLSGVWVLRNSARPLSSAVAGALLGAAFLTKQSALVVAAALVLQTSLVDLRRAAALASGVLVVAGGGSLWLDRASGGWFRYYCAFLPSRHPRMEDGLTAFWTHDLTPALPIATLLTLLYVGRRCIERQSGPDRFFLPALAAGMIGSSWSVRNMVGAEVNNLLPAFAAVALLAAIGHSQIVKRAGWPVAAETLVLLQLVLLVYNPGKHLPTAADRAAGEHLVARVQALPGEVFVPHHGYLARLAGKRDSAHTLAMDNVFLDDNGAARADLQLEMLHALDEHRYSAVLLESDGRYGEAILPAYDPVERLFASPNVFWPVTGGQLRPEVLCLPKQPTATAPP